MINADEKNWGETPTHNKYSGSSYCHGETTAHFLYMLRPRVSHRPLILPSDLATGWVPITGSGLT